MQNMFASEKHCDEIIQKYQNIREKPIVFDITMNQFYKVQNARTFGYNATSNGVKYETIPKTFSVIEFCKICKKN